MRTQIASGECRHHTYQLLHTQEPLASGKEAEEEQLSLQGAGTWNCSWMGGRAHWRFSLVVAISSTEAISDASLSPGNFLNFHTSACRFASYFALPPPDTCAKHDNRSMGTS